MAPNPVPIKALLSKMGLMQNFVRRPLVGLGEQERLELLECLNSIKQSTEQS